MGTFMQIQTLLDKVGSRSAAPSSAVASAPLASSVLTPDQQLILKAFQFAEKAHAGQSRLSGDPYITHVLAVAEILADLHMDPVILAASILHDTLEDTTASFEILKTEFGEEVATLVEGVTKLSKQEFVDGTQRQSESLRKMLVAMAKDVRVILIKLADRLHNMRTLQFLPVEKQQKIAKETQDIYAPLAHRLGMARIRSEMEDLCFRYLDPDNYYDLTHRVFLKQAERDDMIRMVIRDLKEKLRVAGLEGQITGRSKHYASIWRKMTTQNKAFDEIFDLLAIRVLTNSLRDCYEILGLVHTMWKPMPGRFKDYIAMPKENGYQSIHTTVMGPEGQPLEIQIRTQEMHDTAEVGIAAHWTYKEGRPVQNADRKFAAMRGLVELQQDIREQSEFTQAAKMDVFEDEVFAFTPKGDVKELPKGATALDFAYAVHSDVGTHCMGVKVNGHMVPLKYQLQSGDIVEVLTQSNRVPSRDWLKIAVTNRAKNKIRHWFRTHLTEDEIQRGRETLEKEADRAGVDLPAAMKSGQLDRLISFFNCHNMDELLANIGHGEVSARSFLNKWVAQQEEGEDEKTLPAVPKPSPRISKESEKNALHSSQGIVMEGQRDLLVRFARCCTPLPGDPIVGYITRGRGVSIHRADCSNTLNLAEDQGRMVQVSWEKAGTLATPGQRYEVAVEVRAKDRQNLMADMLMAVTSIGVKINEATTKAMSGGEAQGYFLIEISSAAQLEEVRRKLLGVSGTLKVYRTEPR